MEQLISDWDITGLLYRLGESDKKIFPQRNGNFKTQNGRKTTPEQVVTIDKRNSKK